MKIKTITLTQLQAHPKRDNVCPAEVKVKIQRHMERTGQYEPLVIYSDPDCPNVYTIINGHVRFEIAQALGWRKMECAIWDVTPAEAELALATLNTLKGISDQQKRWDLLVSLQSQFSIEDLQLLLPESQEALVDLLVLQALDQEKQEKAFQAALEAERKELPITLTFVVMPDEKLIVDDVLEQFEDQNRSAALISLCKAWQGEQDNE